MNDFDIDQAMSVYLGGEARSGEIQVGAGEQRLQAAFGDVSADIQPRLDQMLATARQRHAQGFGPGESIVTWLMKEFPQLSRECVRKIESHVLYFNVH